VLAALTLQEAIILIGFWNRVDGTDFGYDMDWTTKIHVDIMSLINADFAVAAILISFGAVLGKANLFQVSFMALIEVIFYSLNMMLLGCGNAGVCTADIGGSIVIHTFGAYFGLAVSFQLAGSDAISSADCSSNKVSDLFSMLGTLFLWMFWPSFNSAPAVTAIEQNRAVVNTILSICSSCLAAFVFSAAFSKNHKFQMVHIQNATLAGGVGIGTLANMTVHPGGAVLIGFFAGLLSTFGFRYVTPFLESKIKLHDTCGVHNLHGMPGLYSGLISILVAGVSKLQEYDGTYYDVFLKRSERTSGEQAGYQALGIAITLGVAILSGTITGVVIKQPFFKTPSKMFDDKVYWDYETALEHGHLAPKVDH
jgi:ammonium transporter Rh